MNNTKIPNRKRYENIIKKAVQGIHIQTGGTLSNKKEKEIKAELSDKLCDIFLGRHYPEQFHGENGLCKIEAKVSRINPFSGTTYDHARSEDLKNFFTFSGLSRSTFTQQHYNKPYLIVWEVSLEDIKSVADKVWGENNEITFMQYGFS